jgi:hypothetical protein
MDYTSDIPMRRIQRFYFPLIARFAMLSLRRETPRRTHSMGASPIFRPKGKESLMTTPMFASIRTYHGAPLLSDELFKHQDAIESALRPIRGFHAYYLLKTADGAVSMTVCTDRAGAEESNRVAASWLKDKLPTFASRAPDVTTGELRMQLEPELVKVNA